MSSDKRIDLEKEFREWVSFGRHRDESGKSFTAIEWAKSIAKRVEEQTIQRIEGLLQHGYVEGQVERLYAQRASGEKGE